MKSYVPVALFAYARPEHLARTLEGLRRNQVPIIYAFSDGARTPDKQETISQVRRILHSIDWCDIQVIEREENLGLGKSIRMGVSYVLEKFEQVIVIEDDIVLRPNAYEYVVNALQAYKEAENVMSISMWTHPFITPANTNQGFFAERFVCWGWATYRDSWKYYIGEPLEIYQECQKNKIQCLNWGKDLKIQAEIAAEKNLWYVGYALTHFLHHKLSYFPAESLVANIGFDGTGENCGNQLDANETQKISQAVTIPKEWPSAIVAQNLDRHFASYFYPNQSIWKRKINSAKRRLKGLWNKVLQIF